MGSSALVLRRPGRVSVLGAGMVSLVLIVIAVGVIAPCRAEAAFPGPNGKIVFSRANDLYTVNADGSGLTNITNTDSSVRESAPAWSADGSKIAFLSDGRQSSSDTDIYVMSSDGSDVRRITSGIVCDGPPSWSPDGTKLAFSCNSTNIWTINADGTNPQQLTHRSSGFGDTAPAWSPDGSRIAFSRRDSNVSNIYVMNADGTGQAPVTQNLTDAFADSPNWSPDGNKIVYSGGGNGSDPNNVNDVYTISANGTNQTRLTSGVEWDLYPAWAPDGTKIVFARYSSCVQGPCTSHLWTINPDGTQAVQITADPSVLEGEPDWGIAGVLPPPPPDQPGRIAFASARDITSESSVLDAQEIYTMNPDGTGVRRLTQNHVADTDPAWSPDGTKIAFDSARTPTGIYAMNADGSGQTFLGAGSNPSWSPDGAHIVFHDTGELTVINADGTNRTDLGVRGVDPSWSPDGTRIAFSTFTQDVPGGQDIYTVAADGSDLVRVTTNPRDENLPAWSSDGTRLAFERVEPDPNPTMRPNIWTINADGSGEHQVTTVTSNVGARHPTWSPDNSQIAFMSDGGPDGNDQDIYAINADGSGAPTNLTNSPRLNSWFNRFPSWQPIVQLGGYPRPKGATPVRVALVPAFAPCAAPNRTHGAPLAFGSCAPPQQRSSYLTVGTPDANGAQPNSVASERIDVLAGNPATPADEADVRFNVSVTDVRNQSGLSDYTGELRAVHTLRLTDRASSGPAAATVQDLPLAFAVPCVRQPPSGIGASCTATTTADAVVPGAVPEGKRSIWAFGQVQVYDGGADGDADTPADNTLFLTQGVFVP